jgi:2-amino-4-hydroxy-6-hydroxymethyldihydropteridine diphosphokinase
MARVYVSLGSNVDREIKIRQAVDLLREHFKEIDLSPVYDSAAVGFDGSNFLNLVAGFDTDDNMVLDIPGIRIPRPEILHNAFVLKPLQDVAGDRLHPENRESYALLWQRMAKDAPRLDLFPLDL